MYLALFLHLYQPPTQFAKVLKSISDASYSRLLNIIRKYPSAKLTSNISGSLTKQLAAHADLRRLLADFADLVKLGQIELVGSAAYHPLLTEIPKEEVRRQILLNDAINRHYFGEVYRPRGFFPPEMAVNQRVLEVVRELGFEWVVVDQSAVLALGLSRSPRGTPGLLYFKGRTPYGSLRQPLRLFIRDTDLSVKVAFNQIHTVNDLKSKTKSYQLSTTNYPLILAMDGETFGHHQPGQFKFLEELLASGDFELLTLSELSKKISVGAEVEIQESSWGPWERWKNPKNPIHLLQWELTDLAIRSVNSSKCKVQNSKFRAKLADLIGQFKVKSYEYNNNLTIQQFSNKQLQGHLTSDQKQWLRARELLDRSLHSDQFWWAAATPCWHYQMVERGARMLRDVVLMVPDVSEKRKSKAKEFYEQIISTGKKLHGECIIEG